MVVFTKLVKWLMAAAVFLEVWYGLLNGWIPVDLSPQMYQMLVPMPLYAIMCLGCYALATIGYRLMTFNDCENASKELRRDIEDARRDLTSKGLKF